MIGIDAFNAFSSRSSVSRSVSTHDDRWHDDDVVVVVLVAAAQEEEMWTVESADIVDVVDVVQCVD